MSEILSTQHVPNKETAAHESLTQHTPIHPHTVHSLVLYALQAPAVNCLGGFRANNMLELGIRGMGSLVLRGRKREKGSLSLPSIILHASPMNTKSQADGGAASVPSMTVPLLGCVCVGGVGWGGIYMR